MTFFKCDHAISTSSLFCFTTFHWARYVCGPDQRHHHVLSLCNFHIARSVGISWPILWVLNACSLVRKLIQTLLLLHRFNKAIVDIRLRPRCAIPPPPLRPEIFRIVFALAWHTEWSFLLHGVIGDWMIPFAATLQRLVQRDCQCFWMARTIPENCPFILGDLHPHLTYGSMGQPVSSPKTACRSVQMFLHSAL